MYLEYFNIKELPFTLTPNTQFFCKLPGHHEALNILLLNLRNGEGFIKITGNIGSGKTLLCRMLLDVLGDDFFTAYIPNPDLGPLDLRKALAQELGISTGGLNDPHVLLTAIIKRLMKLHASGKKVVLIIDEAQALPVESLEAIRLLTNLETENNKLLQVVLFGQPELDNRLNQHSLIQLRQRIGFSYKLPLLKYKELRTYVNHRLAAAGCQFQNIFSPAACWLLFIKSKGIPRLINILCHKAMMAAYGRGEARISFRSMLEATSDTEAVSRSNLVYRTISILGLSLSMICMILVFYLLGMR